MPDNTHDDQLDPAIRNRLYTGRPAVDALNSTVPQADAERRDALEQRLMARVLEGKAPGKNRPMIHNAAIQGAYETPRRFQISTSLLLTGAVGVLCAAVLTFASFNRPPNEQLPVAVAPVNQDQDATAVPPVTVTPTPLEATATPIPFEGQGAVPTTVPLTAMPHDPNSVITVTPVPFTGEVSNNAITHIVQAGESILDVAERYGIETDSLVRLNNLDPEAPLEVGRQLVVSILEIGATVVPFVTSTPIPFSVNLYVPTYVPFAGDHVAPPNVWFFGDGHVSAPESSGLMVGLPADRIEATSGETPIAAGQILNFYTTVSVPKEHAPAAATDRDLENPSDVVVALVPVAASIEVMSVNEDGGAIIRVSVEQGIVLNWLLNDTPARIYYGRAE